MHYYCYYFWLALAIPNATVPIYAEVFRCCCIRHFILAQRTNHLTSAFYWRFFVIILFSFVFILFGVCLCLNVAYSGNTKPNVCKMKCQLEKIKIDNSMSRYFEMDSMINKCVNSFWIVAIKMVLRCGQQKLGTLKRVSAF